jgi:tRNA 2-thiouridine synthesizing protein B
MLHIVNHALFDSAQVERLLSRIGKGHTLMLIENGVYMVKCGSAAAERLERSLSDLTVCVLDPDLAARGITAAEVMAGVIVVDYEGFVDLTVDNAVIHSWK